MHDCTDPYQAILKKALERNIPFKVLWELTYHCNLHCIHCYRVEKPRPELSTPEAKDLIDSLAGEGCLYITFSGGEPLTREDFFEVAKYARSRGFAIRLFTNGTLITPAVAQELQSLHPISVEVSVYGICQATFEKITQVEGSFDQVLEGLRLLREARIKTVIKCPLMTLNFSERRGIEELAHGLDADVNFDSKMSPKNDGAKEPLAFQITTEQMEDFLKEEEWYPLDEKDDFPPCNAGKTIATISPYGDVFPCVQLRLPTGNIREKPFHQIWCESQILRNLRSIRGRDLKDCVNCSYTDYCVRCPGLAHLETGDMLGKSPLACHEGRIRASLNKNISNAIGSWS
jgi:radical SAM protein with 4Fe4S-binding SPASM domain